MRLFQESFQKKNRFFSASAKTITKQDAASSSDCGTPEKQDSDRGVPGGLPSAHGLRARGKISGISGTE